MPGRLRSHDRCSFGSLKLEEGAEILEIKNFVIGDPFDQVGYPTRRYYVATKLREQGMVAAHDDRLASCLRPRAILHFVQQSGHRELLDAT